jgi:transposase-like protein
MTRQNATNPDVCNWELTPQQEAAVDLLALGRSITDVAKEVGVARQTLSLWRNKQPSFQAAFNLRRRELWEAASERLRTLVPGALDVLESAVANGDLRAALGVLKAAGLHGLEPPEGPIEPQDAEIAMKEEESARSSRIFLASLR